MEPWPDVEACTLPTVERPTRVGEFDALFAGWLADVSRVDQHTLILRFRDAPGLRDLVADLTRRESECCTFWDFSVSAGPGLVLHVRVPPAYDDVLDAFAVRAADRRTP